MIKFKNKKVIFLSSKFLTLTMTLFAVFFTTLFILILLDQVTGPPHAKFVAFFVASFFIFCSFVLMFSYIVIDKKKRTIYIRQFWRKKLDIDEVDRFEINMINKGNPSSFFNVRVYRKDGTFHTFHGYSKLSLSNKKENKATQRIVDYLNEELKKYR